MHIKSLIVKLNSKRPFGRHRRRCESNIKMNLGLFVDFWLYYCTMCRSVGLCSQPSIFLTCDLRCWERSLPQSDTKLCDTIFTDPRHCLVPVPNVLGSKLARWPLLSVIILYSADSFTLPRSAADRSQRLAVSRDGSVSILTGCGVDDRGWIPRRDRFFSAPPLCPYKLWGLSCGPLQSGRSLKLTNKSFPPIPHTFSWRVLVNPLKHTGNYMYRLL
jgi:hypothetical protein